MRLRIRRKTVTIRVRDDLLTGIYAQNLRKSLNKTLRDISELSGYTIGYISDLEHGRKSWSEDKLRWYEQACNGIRNEKKV